MSATCLMLDLSRLWSLDCASSCKVPQSAPSFGRLVVSSRAREPSMQSFKAWDDGVYLHCECQSHWPTTPGRLDACHSYSLSPLLFLVVRPYPPSPLPFPVVRPYPPSPLPFPVAREEALLIFGLCTWLMKCKADIKEKIMVTTSNYNQLS